MFDGKAFGKEVVAVVKAHMEKTVAPLLEQIGAMRAEIDALKAVPPPKDGKDADQEAIAEAVAAIIAGNMRKDFDELRSDLDGIIPKLDDLNGRIGEEIAAVADHHFGAPDHTENLIKQMVAESVAALPPAEKGKDADPEQVASLVKQEAERILAGWERPKDGKDGAPGEKGMDGAAGRDGKDGLDAVDVMIDREGDLVFTMADGRMKNVGLVVGRDGAPGKDGLAGMPGINGKDGLDAVGFDDMDLVIDEEGVMIKFVKGENVKSFRIPVPIDRGVFKEGTQYRKGDGVSFGGSWFIAQEDTAEKPENGKGWRLAVKRGRDGKDGELKQAREIKPIKVG